MHIRHDMYLYRFGLFPRAREDMFLPEGVGDTLRLTRRDEPPGVINSSVPLLQSFIKTAGLTTHGSFMLPIGMNME